jgi:hypothetical protein
VNARTDGSEAHAKFLGQRLQTARGVHYVTDCRKRPRFAIPHLPDGGRARVDAGSEGQRMAEVLLETRVQRAYAFLDTARRVQCLPRRLGKVGWVAT